MQKMDSKYAISVFTDLNRQIEKLILSIQNGLFSILIFISFIYLIGKIFLNSHLELNYHIRSTILNIFSNKFNFIKKEKLYDS